eukprot:1139689-Pelagomonas_calceolata.AAC.3
MPVLALWPPPLDAAKRPPSEQSCAAAPCAVAFRSAALGCLPPSGIGQQRGHSVHASGKQYCHSVSV